MYRGRERRLEGCHGISRPAMLLRVMLCVSCVFPTPVTYSVARHDLEERLQKVHIVSGLRREIRLQKPRLANAWLCMETLTGGDNPSQ